ncbi:YebG family protein [Erwinia mallotivora]|uniref:YebG family protein n=1 Tax=Erwinia mallotivora TaxID=69222 RepID=UPI0035EDE149
MAVEIKYVVVRKGEEKMTFASKKEADAYDKMLDMAEVFSDWLGVAPLTIDEEQREILGLFLAENKDALAHILRTSKHPERANVSMEGNDLNPAGEPDKAVDAGQESDTLADATDDAEPKNKLKAIGAGKPARASKVA